MKFKIKRREDIILKNKQTNRDFETSRSLGLAKIRDSETLSYEKRDCETHIAAKINETARPLKID